MCCCGKDCTANGYILQKSLLMIIFWLVYYLLYTKHYKLRFVYFYPLFEDHFFVFKEFFKKILSLHMPCIKEWFVIKSKLWWHTFGIWFKLNYYSAVDLASLLLTLSGMGQGIFTCMSLLDQILSAEVFSKISKLFWSWKLR